MGVEQRREARGHVGAQGRRVVVLDVHQVVLDQEVDSGKAMRALLGIEPTPAIGTREHRGGTLDIANAVDEVIQQIDGSDRPGPRRGAGSLWGAQGHQIERGGTERKCSRIDSRSR